MFVGTVRSPRLPGCNLLGEKELKKKDRGTFDTKVERDANIVAVRWYDTRSVILLSTYAGPEPVDTVERRGKTKKEKVVVKRPFIVAQYNKFMGGIDLMDSFVAKYKYHMKSRRWYMYLL